MHAFFSPGSPLSIYLAHVVKSSTMYDKHFHTRDCTAQYLSISAWNIDINIKHVRMSEQSVNQISQQKCKPR